MIDVSLIAQEINKALDEIFELEWKLKETRKKFNKLHIQLEEWIENSKK